MASAVEMSVARWRALTHDFEICTVGISNVEMSVARLRALTHMFIIVSSFSASRRNECGPFEGIDTLSKKLC